MFFTGGMTMRKELSDKAVDIDKMLILRRLIDQGTSYKKRDEITKTKEFEKFVIAYSFHGLFGALSNIPKIQEKTQEEIATITSSYESLFKNAAMWAVNQTNVMAELRRKSLKVTAENLDNLSSDKHIKKDEDTSSALARCLISSGPGVLSPRS